MISRRTHRSLSCLLLVALLSTACQSRSVEAPIATADNPSSDCRTVEHEMGETEVCGQPQRVAVLNPHTLDIVLSLGVQPFAYAESAVLNLQTFDQPAEQIPHLGRYVTTEPINVGDRKNPSLERLAQIQPDLILSEDWLVEGQYDLLSQIAPTLLFTDEKNGQQHWRYDIEGIAKALGRESQAEELLARYPEQVAAVREQLAPVVAAIQKF
ncbi:MAG: ABC transporter substrate-binding protein [Phormidesmis sp. RL_2_1]|nr:ABC transporter substrate-binding protein [Phormidesmis sp. RL_2_1]